MSSKRRPSPRARGAGNRPRPAPSKAPAARPAAPAGQSHGPDDPGGEDDFVARAVDLVGADGDAPLRPAGVQAPPVAPSEQPRQHPDRRAHGPDAGDADLGEEDDDHDETDDLSALDEEGDWADEAWADDLAAAGDEMAAGSGEETTGVRARRPLIALVGRPNVGKSRLFNRMTETRFAIVEDMPGVTRDRQYGDGVWDGCAFQVVDTGGFEPETRDVLLAQMKSQAEIAMAEADIIFFLMDARAGCLPADQEIAALLRRSDRIVIPVVNKVDGDRHEALVGDFYALGLDEPVAISAEHGRNFDELMDRVLPYLPRIADVERADEDEISVAVIGRPNAGKSTLVNRLLGEERLLTSDVPGTTRDAVNTRITVDGQRYLFIDTAGVRRKRSIHEQVERYSVVQAFKAIDRADVVLHVLDASDEGFGIATQDKRIAGMAHEKGRAAVILLNKWDAVEKDHRTADERIRQVRDDLRFNRYAPVVTISAATGQRVHRILPIVQQVHAEYTRRVSTAALNRVLREALTRNPPPSKGRRRFKVYYASQVATAPPTLMLVVNQKALLHFSYERYLRNCLREAFAFEGTPLKIFLRERAQRRGEPEPETIG